MIFINADPDLEAMSDELKLISQDYFKLLCRILRCQAEIAAISESNKNKNQPS